MRALAGLLLLLSLSCTNRVAPYRHPVLAGRGDYKKELLAAEANLRTDPDGPFALATLAGLYVKKGKATGDFELLDRAEAMAMRSLQVLPSFNGRTQLILADIAQARHEFRRSIELVTKALGERNSRVSLEQALPLLVTSHLALGELEAAAKRADQLVELRSSVAAYTLRALVETAQGRDPDARHDFQRALESETFGSPEESAWLRTMMARFHFRHGDAGIASELLVEALRIRPNDAAALGLLAEIELHRGQTADARRHFAEAFNFSHQPIFLLGEARVRSRAGEARAADELRAQAERVIRNELARPGSYGHRLDLVRLLLDRDRPEDRPEALALAKKELEVRQSAETWFLLARALSRSGRTSEAREAIRTALRTGVQDPEYFACASEIERKLKNEAEANYLSGRSRQLGGESCDAA